MKSLSRIGLVVVLLAMFFSTENLAQKTVRYDLVVTDTTVNYTGKTRPAIAINGSIPAPTLTFTIGDTALVYVHNRMHHETSIHWHGLFLPNEQDGVPYLTTASILPHTTHIYKFAIKQTGTYWYHSHTMLQEQIGMYGALVLLPRNYVPPVPEHVLVLSDWRDEGTHHVERSLHNATDWYMIEKRATQNYAEAIQQGHFLTKLESEWKRMHAMDVSDVAYDRFLVNGKTEDHFPDLKPGQQVRLRIINGGAASYFWLTYSGGKITVVANDGNEVEPVEVDRLIVSVSETYDVLVTLPPDGLSHEFVATAEDRTGFASLWLGTGTKQLAKPLPPLKYFEGMKMMNEMMTLGGNMKDMGMNMSLQQMDMNTVMYPEITGAETTETEDETQETAAPENPHAHHQMPNHAAGNIVTLNYAMLRAPHKTTLPEAPMRTMRFELTGNMNRFVWTVDHKTVSEVDKILIKQGENIRIIMTNNSMMRHPMHLHGHDFRVLNGQGEYAPMKNVIDIMPMETDTIEFNANAEYGDWFFHCHILYHMMSGMGRIFRYENTPPNPQIKDPEKANKIVFSDGKRFYPGAEISLESNGTDGEIWTANTRWLLQTEWRLGIKKEYGYETESHFGRYLDNNQFLHAYVGWDYRKHAETETEREENIFGQRNTSRDRGTACLGVFYIMPWFLVTDLRVDHTGNLRLQLTRDDIPITTRLRLWGTVNSDLEYSYGARYILTKYWALSSHYDSDMGLGAGLTFVY